MEKTLYPTAVADSKIVLWAQNTWATITQRTKKPKPTNETKKPHANAYYVNGYTGSRFLFAAGYNGEKNLGEIGPIKDYLPDYGLLRLRAWQSYYESEITVTVLRRFMAWIMGAGLKLQSEPGRDVLLSEGIKLDTQPFSKVTEMRFAVWSKSTVSDYSGMNSLNQIAQEAYKNVWIGGDVLVVLRIKNGDLNVQLIDGAHVMSQYSGTELWPQMLANGNYVINGIEFAPDGKEVAYYVCKNIGEYERIPARNKQGFVISYLVRGKRMRLNNVRGVPRVSPILETLKKLDRYKEATVGSAEERQKIAYSIEQKEFSQDENPMLRNAVKAFNVDSITDELPVDEYGQVLANNIMATTNKSTFFLPKGQALKMLESKNEIYFKEFYEVNFENICAALDIPANVARMIYNDSFSASRAATKDWENTILVEREYFSAQFYGPIYSLWLHLQILLNKIQAPGYLQAFATDNQMVLGAYRNARFTGPMFPHIDPVKEVNAERAKLGPLAANIPLTTVAAATEALNTGDSTTNMEQFASELKLADELDLELTPEPVPGTEPAKKTDKEEED